MFCTSAMAATTPPVQSPLRKSSDMAARIVSTLFSIDGGVPGP